MTARIPTILIVDDEIINIEIMSAALDDAYEICFATSGAQALQVANDILPDLILLDVIMPHMHGFDVCTALKNDPMLADIPVIFITGLGEATDEIHGLSLGAIDYVTKPIRPAILRSRVKNHIELKQLRDNLAEMAVTDSLTGIYNRRNFDRLMQDEVARAAHSGEWLSLIMLDIDHFKQYNDAYGHPQGDSCIRLVAAILRDRAFAAKGFAARYGGEEFACVLPGADHETAMSVAATMRHALTALQLPHVDGVSGGIVTLSQGVATLRPADGNLPYDFTELADRRLYIAKQAGRDRICGEYLDEFSRHLAPKNAAPR